MGKDFIKLLNEIRACRICLDAPLRKKLAHEPRPVLQVSQKAKIAICGQAPGTKVHLSGQPFTDRSGDRLREWMGIGEDVFYDASKLAIIPMGFCYPGQNDKGADLPPRVECKATWHDALFAELPQLELIILVGKYAQAYHLKGHPQFHEYSKFPLYKLVESYRIFLESPVLPRYLPLPHPSWRNNNWVNKNDWFREDYLPLLQAKISKLL